MSRSRVEMYEVASAGLTTATTAYASGDMLGSLMTIPLAKGYGSSRRSGKIIGAVVTDDSDVIGALDLFFFDTTVTNAADNAASSWSDADWRRLVAVMTIGTTVLDNGLNKAMVTSNVALGAPFVAESGSLYMAAVTRTANAVFASGATALNYKIFMELD